MNRSERDEFLVLLARALPDAGCATVLVTARRLMLAANRVQRGWEGYSSFRPPEGDDGFWERMVEAGKALAGKALVQSTPHALTLHTQGDPRGATLWLEDGAAGGRKLYIPAQGFTTRDMERMEWAERARYAREDAARKAGAA